MHNNLFMHGHSRAEVKQAINDHGVRDSKTLKLIDLVFAGCVLVLVRRMELLDAAAIFVGSWAAISGLRYFIDQSNRNFYLHRLDWESAPPD